MSDTNLQIVINAVDQASPALEEVAARTRALGPAMSEAAVQARATWESQMTAIAESGGAVINRMHQLEESLDAVPVKTRIISQEAAAAANDLSRSMADYMSQTGEASAATEEGFAAVRRGAGTASFATAGVTRELVILGHEAMTGNFSRMPGSLVVLASRMQALQTIFKAGVLSEVAAVGLLAAAAVKYGSDQQQMNEALINTGDYAGVTADRLREMAEASTIAGGSTRDAIAMVSNLAASGVMSGEEIQRVSAAIMEMATYGGAKTETLAKQFKALAQAGAEGGNALSKTLGKLDDQYHFLTPVVYDHVKALEEEGRYTEAARVAMDAFADASRSRAAQMRQEQSGWESLGHTIKHFVSDVFYSLTMYYQKSTPGSDVQKWQEEVAKLSNPAWADGSMDITGTWHTEAERVKELAEAQGLLTEAIKRQNDADAQAARQAKATQDAQTARQAMDRIDAELAAAQAKNTDAETAALKRYHDALGKLKDTDPSNARLRPEAVAAGEEAIRQEYAKTAQAAKTASDDEQEGWKNREAAARQYAALVDKLHADWEKDQQDERDLLEKITRQTLPEQELKVQDIHDKYGEMYADLVNMTNDGTINEKKASELRLGLVGAEQREINQITQVHQQAAKTVPDLWDHALNKMTDALANWVASGQDGFAGLERSFSQMVGQMVSTWIMGQNQMTSTQSANLGGNLGVASTMMSGATGYSGIAAGGLGVVNELLHPDATKNAFGALQNNISLGLSNLGRDKAAMYVDSMGPTAFSSAASGLGTFAVDMLSGKSFGQSAASGAGSAAGFAIGNALFPGIGGIIGSIGGSFLGGLFGGGDKEHQFTLSELNPYTADRWNPNGGIPLSTYVDHSSRGPNGWYEPIGNAYIQGMNQTDKAFNDQVIQLKGQMSDAAWSAFANALAAQDLSDTDSGRWGVSSASSAISGALKQYADKLNTALNTALQAALPVIGQGILDNSTSWQYLSSEMQGQIQAALAAPGFTSSSLDQIKQYIGAIDSAMAPITEALATGGMSSYEKSLRAINQQFDQYGVQLAAAGVDLAKYTDLEKARAAAIAQVNQQNELALQGTLASAGQALLQGYQAELSDVDTARTNYLGLLGNERNTLNTLSSTLHATISGIQAARQQIDAASVANLNPDQRLAVLREQIDSYRADALGSDPTKSAIALQNIEQLSSQYVQAAQATRTDWRQYGQDLAYISNLLDVAENSQTQQATVADTQLQAIDATTAALTAQTQTVKDLATAKQAFDTAQAKAVNDNAAAQASTLTSLYGSSKSIEQLLTGYLAAMQSLAQQVVASQQSGGAQASSLAQLAGAAKAAGPQESWQTAPGSAYSTWSSSGGAMGMAPTVNADPNSTLVVTKGGQVVTLARAQQWVTDQLASSGPDAGGAAIYQSAVAAGLSSSSLEKMMGWAAGSANAWADQHGLQHFSSGGSFLVGGPEVGDNLALPNLRVSRGEMVSVSRPDSLSQLREELRELRLEVRTMRENNDIYNAAIVRNVEKTASVMTRAIYDGLPVVVQ